MIEKPSKNKRYGMCLSRNAVNPAPKLSYSFLIEKPSKNKKAWDMSIEDRREPVHGGLTAAIPAADILASHTPYFHKVNHFLNIKGVIRCGLKKLGNK